MKKVLIIASTLFIMGCAKEGSQHPCYDSSLVHNGPCTADCPGFEGCDGKTYCNGCEAARQGIGSR